MEGTIDIKFDLASWFGMDKNMAEIIGEYRCRWLGLVRMDDSTMPKQPLFGALIKTQPRHDLKK